MNQELLNYIKQARGSGKADETIKMELRNAGWPDGNINEALNSIHIQTPGMPAGFANPTPSHIQASAVASGFSGGKMITVIVTLIVLAGGAGLYLFLNRAESEPLAQNTYSPNLPEAPAEEVSGGQTSQGNDCKDLKSVNLPGGGGETVYQSEFPANFPHKSLPIYPGAMIVGYFKPSNPQMADVPMLCISGNHADKIAAFYKITPNQYSGRIESDSVTMISGFMSISGANVQTYVVYTPRPLNRTVIFFLAGKQ
ncbi:MAG: hypothetical protein A2758_00585 [Candidatus Zambryskibacteria bacterium RIFCSPHIGHO2_01_FULL_49_18]|uniref:Uncharacterized protein n=2 Tax=Candidatus Zambryskiibacteriota TaxID=1817925 RepID=A0A1G2T2V6_9BACT|nr:MAG: hypothetical protein A2758_00585 [Candidatus Zambryskibacteria bacterium RIFCSPHIGHO2_01_FULL_49_18]OHB05921.1 MAG: hypothetical protein A3A26_03170 [Candidatus Zambryskibacteria bacterium RIFCSPLOWO2_01_FULL_47_14]